MDTRLYTKALRNLVGEVSFTLEGTDFNSLDFFGAEVTITEDDVLTEYNTVLTEDNLEQLREKRNELLADTDYIEVPSYWTQLTQEQQELWITYRQSLRDITNSYTSLENITWPTKP